MIPKRPDTAPLLWLGLVLAVALSIAFLLPVTPNDYWWYLRVGGDTLAAGAVPQVDTFTYSQVGMPVVYHSWGAAVLFWLVYQTGGLSLTVLGRGLLVVLAYGLLWITSRWLGAGRLGAALVLLLAVLASSNNWSLRPQLFAYPLFALAIFILYRWQEGDDRIVYWLPLLSLLWVNLHGSFVMLVLLVLSALVFPLKTGVRSNWHERRSLVLAAAGVLLGTFLNPRGVGAWTYVFTSLTVPSSQVFSVEWLPPVNDNWQMHIFFAWLLVFPLLTAFSPRKLSLLEWTWFIGFGFLALWGERYIIWFVFILTVLTAGMISEWEKRLFKDPKPGSPLLNRTLGLAFVLLPMVLLPGLRETWWSESPPVTENTPITAAEWLTERPELEGPLWSEIGFSSYLEFSLPERRTWIDTRFEVFPVEQWQAYQDITTARYNWQKLLDDSGANLLIVSTLTQPHLVSALSGSSSWCELYRDDVAVIYDRCGGRK